MRAHRRPKSGARRAGRPAPAQHPALVPLIFLFLTAAIPIGAIYAWPWINPGNRDRQAHESSSALPVQPDPRIAQLELEVARLKSVVQERELTDDRETDSNSVATMSSSGAPTTPPETVAEATVRRSDPWPGAEARVVWRLQAASEYRADALPPLVIAAQDAARARREIVSGRGGDGLLWFIGKDGRMRSDAMEIATTYKSMYASERLRAAKRKHGETPPVVANLTEQQVLRLFLAQVEDLMVTLSDLPRWHDLTEVMGRTRGAGHLLLHLWSLEGMTVPASATQFWKLRRKSVEFCAKALRNDLNSIEAKQLWGEADGLMQQSNQLEPALYGEAGTPPGQQTAADVREAARAVEWKQGETLRGALDAARRRESQARRELDNIRSRPQNRAAVNQSALKSAEAMLRMAEEGTRKAQQEYESHLARISR